MAPLGAGPLGSAVASAATVTSGPLLAQGATGPAVAAWQRQLDTWRVDHHMAPIATDGVYGPITRSATIALQQAAHIAVDGVVGPQTRQAMAGALGSTPVTTARTVPTSGPLLEQGDSGSAVRSWQQSLDVFRSQRGLPAIATDGIFGPQTRAATVQMQQALGISADGIVGPVSRSALDHAIVGTATVASSTSAPRCRTTNLTVGLAPLSPGVGNEGVVIEFTNKGTAVCSLSGYPGATGVTTSGAKVPATRTLAGYFGGVRSGSAPDVRLAPGQTASAIVEGTDVPTAGHTCVTLSSIEVTAPNAYHSTTLRDAMRSCTLQVHPVVPGAKGSYRA